MEFKRDSKYIVYSDTHYIIWNRNPNREQRIFFCYRKGAKNPETNNYCDVLIGDFRCADLGVEEAWRQAKQCCEDDLK